MRAKGIRGVWPIIRNASGWNAGWYTGGVAAAADGTYTTGGRHYGDIGFVTYAYYQLYEIGAEYSSYAYSAARRAYWNVRRSFGTIGLSADGMAGLFAAACDMYFATWKYTTRCRPRSSRD